MGPTQAYINHKNLIHNYHLIRKAVEPAGVMAVVKANAYGHGAVEVAQSLADEGIGYLGVAFHEEGIQLRKAGITVPILVFGAQLTNFFIEHIEHNLDITITSLHQLDPLRALCRSQNCKARVHLKIDTGMGRVGFLPEKDMKTILELLDDEWIDVKGVYSHLSSSDEQDLGYTRLQLNRFKEIREKILARTDQKIIFHLANSGAIMRLPEAFFDMVRPGVMLYGNPPGPDFPLQWDLKEVMRFISRVGLIKELPAGEPVSYNRRFYTSETTRVAVIPVGYADGYNRRLTNTGMVLIGGKRYPVIGTVCMDQIVVNLGSDSSIMEGDEAVLLGEQGDEHISIVEVSRLLNTIPYEVTCWVSERVPRVHLPK